MNGNHWSVPSTHIGRCEICFELLTKYDCAVDLDGDFWDICKGVCATQAGIVEAS